MELLTYLLKVSACTALFFSFYLVFLRKLTFFKINRFYLLLVLFLSFVIPAVQINIEKETGKFAKQVPMVLVDAESIRTVETGQAEILPMPVDKTPFDWFSIVPYIYLSITAILLVICFWQLFRLLRFAKGYKENYEGLKLISKKEGFTNCSFFNYVFINETSLSETDLQVLLKHEQVHANQFHSVDKIVLMIAKAILWFNPIIYLFDKALEQTHEYEADEATSQSFGNNAYANLLLRLAVVKTNTPLLHNFVKSPIKERIKMLFNSKSNNMKRLAYFFVLPIGLGLVWLFSVQMVYIDSKIKNDLVFKAEQALVKQDEVQEKQKLKIKEEFKKELTRSSGNKDTIKLSGLILPKIISSSKIIGDVKKKISYLEDAVIEILGSTIKAKYVELNQNEKILIADHAVITNGGNMVIAEKAVFNLSDGSYRTYESNVEAGEKMSFSDFSLKENENMIAKRIHYSALDSTRISKDKSVISLYGKAKVNFKDVTIDADEITYNTTTQMGSAKNLVITQADSGIKVKGTNAKFNLNGKIEIWQNVGGSLVVEP